MSLNCHVLCHFQPFERKSTGRKQLTQEPVSLDKISGILDKSLKMLFLANLDYLGKECFI